MTERLDETPTTPIVDEHVHVPRARARARTRDDASTGGDAYALSSALDLVSAIVRGDAANAAGPISSSPHEDTTIATLIASIAKRPGVSRNGDATGLISPMSGGENAVVASVRNVRRGPKRMTMSPESAVAMQASSSASIRLPRMTMSPQPAASSALTQAVARMTMAVPSMTDEAPDGAPQRMTMLPNGRSA